MTDSIGFMKNFHINNYYKYILYLAGLILVLSLIFDMKSIDKAYLVKFCIGAIGVSIICWLLDGGIETTNRVLYEKHIKKSVDTLPPHNIMDKYRDKVHTLSIMNIFFQIILWMFFLFIVLK